MQGTAGEAQGAKELDPCLSQQAVTQLLSALGGLAEGSRQTELILFFRLLRPRVAALEAALVLLAQQADQAGARG